MLVLGRKENERIVIGSDIILTVVRCKKDSVKIGIEAPPEIPIFREEIMPTVEGPNDKQRGRL